MRIGDIPPAPPRILLYGPTGVGKSVLAYTLGKRAQCFDFDRGWESGRTTIDLFTQTRREVDIAGPTNKDGHPTGYVDSDPMKPTAFLAFKKDLIETAKKIRDGTYPFKAIIFDSLTTMFQAAMRNVLFNCGKKWEIQDISSLKTFVEIQHWGYVFTDITNVMSIIRSFPLPLVFIAHTQSDVKPGGTERIIELAIAGKNMPDQIPSYFEEFWYMKLVKLEGDKVKRVIQTNSDANISARSRLNIPNLTDTSIGLPAILKLGGFEFKD